MTYIWTSAWARHLVYACKMHCFYCRMAKRLAAPLPWHIQMNNDSIERNWYDRKGRPYQPRSFNTSVYHDNVSGRKTNGPEGYQPPVH